MRHIPIPLTSNLANRLISPRPHVYRNQGGLNLLWFPRVQSCSNDTSRKPFHSEPATQERTLTPLLYGCLDTSTASACIAAPVQLPA